MPRSGAVPSLTAEQLEQLERIPIRQPMSDWLVPTPPDTQDRGQRLLVRPYVRPQEPQRRDGSGSATADTPQTGEDE